MSLQTKNRSVICFVGNLIMMLRLVKNTTFSIAFHRTSDIIKNVTIFEILNTQLLHALCDVNTEGKMLSDRSTPNSSGKNPV